MACVAGTYVTMTMKMIESYVKTNFANLLLSNIFRLTHFSNPPTIALVDLEVSFPK